MARPGSSIFSLLILAVLLTANTGCREHQRLERETEAALRQVGELRERVRDVSARISEYSKRREEAASERDRLRRENSGPSGSKALEDEVAALQAEKTLLEKDLKAIEAEHEGYKKSTL